MATMDVNYGAHTAITSARLIEAVCDARPCGVCALSWRREIESIVTTADRASPGSGGRWALASVAGNVAYLTDLFSKGRAHAMWPARDKPQPPAANLTRDELIAAVQARCPDELVKAAWDYAVERWVAQATDGWFSRVRSSPSTAASDVSRLVSQNSRRANRLYNDGLREAALTAMIQAKPEQRNAHGWKRCCVALLGEVNRAHSPAATCETHDDFVYYARRLSQNISDGGKFATLYHSTPTPERDLVTRGPHGDDVDGGGL